MKTALTTALACLALAAGHAGAASFTVTSLFDDGPGTLRACVQQANITPGPDTITFHPALSGSIRLLSTIFVTDSVTIVGPESRAISIDGTSAGIILRVQNTADIELGLLDLEFHGGQSAVFFQLNAKLNVHRCVFRDFGDDGVLAAGVFNPNWGGAKSLTGTVRSSSFVNNRGFYAGVVITVAKPSGEDLEFINCTFCSNSSSNGAGVAWIWNGGVSGQGTVDFISCTITGNTGGDSGLPNGAIENTGSTLACRVKNCVLSENSAGAGTEANITGQGGLTGNSLEGVNIFSNAMLSPVQIINGMYVRTPLPGSPCIDAAVPDAQVITDQLGKSRPFVVSGSTPAPGSDGSDVGAVERQSSGCGGADVNADGRVDGADLSVMLSTFGFGCP